MSGACYDKKGQQTTGKAQAHCHGAECKLIRKVLLRTLHINCRKLHEVGTCKHNEPCLVSFLPRLQDWRTLPAQGPSGLVPHFSFRCVSARIIFKLGKGVSGNIHSIKCLQLQGSLNFRVSWDLHPAPPCGTPSDSTYSVASESPRYGPT